MRMVSERSEAEDLLQDAFVKIFRELPSFRWQSAPGAWFRRIVINQCLNHIRKKKLVFVALDDAEVSGMPGEDEFTIEIPAGEIHQAILKLPEGARVVFVLHLLEGFKHTEIADVLGISASTSKSQYRRAISLLQQSLTKKMYAGQI